MAVVSCFKIENNFFCLFLFSRHVVMANAAVAVAVAVAVAADADGVVEHCVGIIKA